MTRDSGKDHERIWLQSYDDTEALGEDRLWCQDKVWPDDPEDHEPTEYIRADLFAALEAERDELKAGIKRLSDEEELINETGRDGMLTAVHIGARLAEAEELARVMEAEANQMREVSISHRNRAEALEESLKTVLASLVATTSLIIRAEDLKVKPSKAVASDKMFTQMLKDYDKATIAGRAALKGDS